MASQATKFCLRSVSIGLEYVMSWNFTKIRMWRWKKSRWKLHPFPSWMEKQHPSCRHGGLTAMSASPPVWLFGTGPNMGLDRWVEELAASFAALSQMWPTKTPLLVGFFHWLYIVSFEAFSSTMLMDFSTARFISCQSPRPILWPPSWSWFGRRRVHCWRMAVNERRIWIPWDLIKPYVWRCTYRWINQYAGQIITTSAGVTFNGGLVRKTPKSP